MLSLLSMSLIITMEHSLPLDKTLLTMSQKRIRVIIAFFRVTM